MAQVTKYSTPVQLNWSVSMAAIAAAATLFLSAAQAADMPGQASKMGAAPAPTNKGAASGSMDMHKGMMGGMKEMETMPMSGDADQDFAMMMKKHHQMALDMAEVELRNGKDGKMRQMAKNIIASQTKEIKEFDLWLGKNKNGGKMKGDMSMKGEKK